RRLTCRPSGPILTDPVAARPSRPSRVASARPVVELLPARTGKPRRSAALLLPDCRRRRAEPVERPDVSLASRCPAAARPTLGAAAGSRRAASASPRRLPRPAAGPAARLARSGAVLAARPALPAVALAAPGRPAVG